MDLATRFYHYTKPSVGEWLDDHVVHFTQRFRYPGNYYVQSRAAWHLGASEYWYNQHLSTWGQQPRGAFGADERIRPGCVDPRQAIETCGMVEFAKSFYILGRITGDCIYADRCEDVMLNHFPAAQTPDLKAGAFQFGGNLHDAPSHRPRGRSKHIAKYRLLALDPSPRTGTRALAPELKCTP